IEEPRMRPMRLQILGVLLREKLRKPESRPHMREDQRQSQQADDTRGRKRLSDFGSILIFGQQPVDVKRQRNRREQEEEGHVSELIKSQEQEKPREQPCLQGNGSRGP